MMHAQDETTVTLWRRGGTNSRGILAWLAARHDDAPLLHWMEPQPEGRIAEARSRPSSFEGLARGAVPRDAPPLDEVRVFGAGGCAHAAISDDGVSCRWVEWLESEERPGEGWEGPFVATRSVTSVYLRRDLARFGLAEPANDARVQVLQYILDGAPACWRLLPLQEGV